MADVKMVAKGREITANRVKGLGTEPKYAHWGEDDGTILPLADGNTALGSPRNEARVEGTSSIVKTITDNDTYRVVGTITAGSAAAIKEAALFDGAGTGTPPTGDNLFIRGTFNVINLDQDDSLQLTVDAAYKQPSV